MAAGNRFYLEIFGIAEIGEVRLPDLSTFGTDLCVFMQRNCTPVVFVFQANAGVIFEHDYRTFKARVSPGGSYRSL